MAVELVRRGRADIDSQPDIFGTALRKATYYGGLEMTKTLLRGGAEVNIPNVGGQMPLHYAPNSGAGAAAITEELVTAGADVDAVGRVLPFDKTPLRLAVSGERRCHERDPSIRALVGAGADPHMRLEFTVTPVEMPIIGENSGEALSVFLELGVDPN